MPDTPRTLAALQALFADNTSGDISPQDLRDFLVSVGLITGTGELGGTADAPTITSVHAGSAHHTEDHDHDGSPTQKLLAANTHESPSADTHHAQSHGHTGADSSGTVAHSALTGVSANQHHNRLHTMTNVSDHSGSVRGDILYGSVPLGTSWAALAGNGATQKKALVQAGDGVDPNAPAWEQIAAADVTIADAGSDFTATTVEGALDELQADNEAHVAAGDPHPGYRLESADHSHQTTGLQAGQLDHGAALTGLSDDDHSAYLLASDATNRSNFATKWTDLTDGGGTTLHTHAGAGHTIQDDNSSMTARTNLSFQDGFVLTDDAGGDQTEVDLSYGGTGDIADVAYTEAAGTAITVARGDHVHALGSSFREIFIPAERFRPTLTAGCAAPHPIDSGSNDILAFVLDFDAAADEFAVCKLGFPSAYSGGTITLYFAWMANSTTTTHTVRWAAKAGYFQQATALNTAYGTEVYVEDNIVNATANQWLLSDALTVDPANKASGRGMLMLQIGRDADHANDDLTVDARLLGVWVCW